MLLVLVFAILSGVFHFVFFLLESVFLKKPRVYHIFGFGESDLPRVSILMLNQGVYNLFLSSGIFYAAFVYAREQRIDILVYLSLYMVGAAVTLLVSRPGMYRGAMIQGVPPLITLVLLLVDGVIQGSP